MRGNPRLWGSLSATPAFAFAAFLALLAFGIAPAYGASAHPANATAANAILYSAVENIIPAMLATMQTYGAPASNSITPATSNSGSSTTSQQLVNYWIQLISSSSQDASSVDTGLSQMSSIPINLPSSTIQVTVGGVTTYIAIPQISESYFIPNSMSSTIQAAFQSALSQATQSVMLQLQSQIQSDIQNELSTSLGGSAVPQVASEVASSVSSELSTYLQNEMSVALQPSVGTVMTQQQISSISSNVYQGVQSDLQSQLNNAVSTSLSSYIPQSGQGSLSSLSSGIVSGIMPSIESGIGTATQSALSPYVGQQFTLSEASVIPQQVESAAISSVSTSVGSYMQSNLQSIIPGYTGGIPSGSSLLSSALQSELQSSLGSALSSELGSGFSSNLQQNLYNTLSASLSQNLPHTLTSGDVSSLSSTLSSQLSSQLSSSLQQELSQQISSDVSQPMSQYMSQYISQNLAQSLGTSVSSGIAQSMAQSFSQSISSSLSQSLSQTLGSSLQSSLSQGLSQGFANSLGSSMSSALGTSTQTFETNLQSSLQGSLQNSLQSSLSGIQGDLQSNLQSSLQQAIQSNLQSSLQSSLSSSLSSAISQSVYSSMQSSLQNSLQSSLQSSLSSSLGSAFQSSLQSSIQSQLSSQLQNSVGSALSSSLASSLSSSLSSSITSNLQQYLPNAISSSLSSSLGNSLSSSLYSSLSTSLSSSLSSSVSSLLTNQLGSSVSSAIAQGVPQGIASTLSQPLQQGLQNAFSSGLSSSLNSALLQTFGSSASSAITSSLLSNMGQSLSQTIGASFPSSAQQGLANAFTTGVQSSFINGVGTGFQNGIGSLSGTISKGIGSALSSTATQALSGAMQNSLASVLPSSLSGAVGSALGSGISGTLASSLTNTFGSSILSSGTSGTTGLSQSLSTSLSSSVGSYLGEQSSSELPAALQGLQFTKFQSTFSSEFSNIPQTSGSEASAAGSSWSQSSGSSGQSLSYLGTAMSLINGQFGIFSLDVPVEFTTSYSSSSTAAATASQGAEQVVSPTNEVVAYNSKPALAGWFLTCPTSSMGMYSASAKLVGGNACINTVPQLTSAVVLHSTVYNFYVEPAFTELKGLNAYNLALFLSDVYAYSPQVDGELSNGFSTKSYIFNSVPSFAQHALWAWSAPYADLSKAKTPASNSYSSTGFIVAGYCNYKYDYNVKETLNWVKNINIPFDYVNSMTTNKGTAFTEQDEPVLPYLFLNWNITTNPQTTYTTPNLTGLAYGIFTPLKYGGAFNAIEPYPIDIHGTLVANFSSDNGKTYNTVVFNSSGTAIDLGSNEAIISGSAYNLVSLASTPNDYVYLLLSNTVSSGTLDLSSTTQYYIAIARTITKGYYQNPSPSFPSDVHCTSVTAGAYSSSTQAGTSCSQSSLQSQFNDNWNNYWKSMAVQDNVSMYLVTQPSQFISMPTTFIPYNITVDYKGDMFLVGTYNNPNNNWFAPYANGSIGAPAQYTPPSLSFASTQPSITATYDSSTGYIKITGSGFTGNEGLIVYLGNDAYHCQLGNGINAKGGSLDVEISDCLPGSIGGSSMQFPGGTFYVQVTNGNNELSNKASLFISTKGSSSKPTATATYDSSTGKIKISGSGFGSSDAISILITDQLDNQCSLSATASSGSFSTESNFCQSVSGPVLPGTYTVDVSDQTAGTEASATVTVSAPPSSISITVVYDPISGVMDITGSGFSDNTQVKLTLYAGNGNTGTYCQTGEGLQNPQSDQNGNLKASMSNCMGYPSAAFTAGTYTLQAEDTKTGAMSNMFVITVPAGAAATNGKTTLLKYQNLVANTIGICTSQTCFKETVFQPATLKTLKIEDIAASPSGLQLYLSSQFDGGAIYVVSGNDLTYQSTIGLGYTADSSTVSKDKNSNPTTSPASLNITYWLENNGLYNQSLTWLPPGSNPFEKAGNNFDQNYFHHPLGIADVNGYLYVLDDWKGIVGGNDPTALSGQSDNGIFFNILTLRILNSTGSNVPVQPTLFNDMFTLSTCAPTSNFINELANTCVSAAETGAKPNSYWCTPPNTAQNVGCYLAPVPNTCNVQNFINNLGTQIGVSASYVSQYECVSTGSQSPSYASLSTGSPLVSAATYPPYGWVLSANITGVDQGSIKDSFSLCSSQACSTFPWFLVQGQEQNNKYYGGYAPLGPAIKALGNSDGSGCSGKCNAFETIYGTGFTVNYNNTAAVLFSNKSNQYSSDEGLMNWGELLLANVNWQNYTNLFNGVQHYSCIIKGKSVYGTSELSACSVNSYPPYSNNPGAYNTLVDSFSAPILLIGDPFKYYENLGTQQPLGISNEFGSTFNSGNSGTGTGSPSQQVSKSCASQAEAGQIPIACTSQNTAPGTPNIGNIGSVTTSQALQSAPIAVPKLTANVGGEVLVPYAWSGTVAQSWTNIQLEYGGYGCPPSLPDIYETTAKTEYTYSAVKPSLPASQTSLSANIEGGSTYLEYQNAFQNGPYIPNLSDFGTYLQPQIFMNVSSDRAFGGMYVNITASSTSNRQEVLNATQQLNYKINTVTVNPEMSYQTISSYPVGPLYGPGYAAGIAQTSVYKPIDTGFNFTQFLSGSSGFVNLYLFNIYQQFVYESPLRLFINSTDQGLPYGYRRLVYVLQDRFNNTIYAPIDTDISRFTVINMSTYPTVSPVNANQTTVTINGTVGYYAFNNLGPQYQPLANGYLYLYYQNNVNYLSYNMMDNGNNNNKYDAEICAFGTQSDQKYASLNCNLADPINKEQAAEANAINYQPQYNSISAQTCNPATVALPQQTYNCNIYKDTNICQVQSKAAGYPMYCVPQDSAGDGVCTSQLGLIGAVPTNAMGYFTTNIVACGISQARIVAQYYGTPPPEPANAIQAPLYMSADPSVPNTGVSLANPGLHPTQLTFPVYNYTWIPNDTASTFQIGLWELSFGNISAIEVISLVAAVGALMAFKLSRARGKSGTRNKTTRNRQRRGK